MHHAPSDRAQTITVCAVAQARDIRMPRSDTGTPVLRQAVTPSSQSVRDPRSSLPEPNASSSPKPVSCALLPKDRLSSLAQEPVLVRVQQQRHQRPQQVRREPLHPWPWPSEPLQPQRALPDGRLRFCVFSWWVPFNVKMSEQKLVQGELPGLGRLQSSLFRGLQFSPRFQRHASID